MKNIIFLTKNFNLIGGVEKFITTFYENVNGSEYNVEIWCKFKHNVDLGIPCIQFKDTELIEEKLASFNYSDTVFISINEAYGELYHKIEKYKLILAVRGQYSYLMNKPEFQQQFSYNKIVTLTDIDEMMFKFTGNKDITTISNYIDLQEQNFGTINGPITMVGRLSIEKNFRHLLEIAPLINKKIIAYVSVLEFAKEELKQINHEIKKRGLENKLEFIVGETDKNTIYKGKSIVLNLSSIESFGNTILEGMSFGLPVIGYDVTPGVEFLVKDNGYKVSYEDYNAVAEKINMLTDDASLYKELSDKSYNRANTFTKENTINSWKKTIDEVFDLEKKLFIYPQSKNNLVITNEKAKIKPQVIMITNKEPSSKLKQFYKIFRISNIEMLNNTLFINNKYFKENYYEIESAYIDVDFNSLSNIAVVNQMKKILKKNHISIHNITNPQNISANKIFNLEQMRAAHAKKEEYYIKIPKSSSPGLEIEMALKSISPIYTTIVDYDEMKYFKPVIEIRQDELIKNNNINFIIDKVLNDELMVIGPTIKKISKVHLIKPKEKILVLTGLFPDENNAYANQFVYTRVKSYISKCQVDVGVTNNSIEKSLKHTKRVFKGINVYEYHSKELINLISNEKYTKIIVHFNNPHFLNIISEFPIIKKYIWVHGGDCQSINRRPYVHNKVTYIKEFENRKQLSAMADSAFLPNVKFIFPSRWLKDVYEQDVLECKGKIDYEINSNIIDINTFKHVERDFKKLKVLVVKSYASEVYATDIVQNVIMSLNKYKVFDDIEFTIIGKGKLWEQNTKKLTEFDNVKLINEFFPHDQLVKFYHQNNILLAPTRTDSQGVSRLEAMSTGMISLSTNIAAIKEFNSPGSLLIKNNLTEEFVEAILNLVTLDETELLEMSALNSNYVKEELNFEQILNKDFDILDI